MSEQERSRDSAPGPTEATWAALEGAGTHATVTFDVSSLVGLPEPAQRFLRAAIPAEAPLARAVVLEMVGRIRLVGRWLPFTARQILCAGVGFVWRPEVGGRVLRFVGADVLGPDGARMEFRLHGRIPVVRADGPDIARSAAGRLAAETVVWLPQGITPQAGASWRPVDDDRAVVAVPVPDGTIDVEVTIGRDGRLRELGLERWNGSSKPPALQSFGGTVSDIDTFDRITVAARGVVGWDWHTEDQADGEFFRYSITSARFL
jgi:hypothetical protein